MIQGFHSFLIDFFCFVGRTLKNLIPAYLKTPFYPKHSFLVKIIGHPPNESWTFMLVFGRGFSVKSYRD